MPAGRPSVYNPEFCEIAANLCVQGATDFEVAEYLEVHVSTLYRWKVTHPEFRDALKVGKEAADDRVEASLYHRAVGYSHPAVKIFMPAGASSPIYAEYTEHAPPDVGAATLWLTNRRGDKWRAKQAIEHSGRDGAPIQYEDNRERNLRAIEQLSARVTGPAPGAPAGAGDAGADSQPLPAADP